MRLILITFLGIVWSGTVLAAGVCHAPKCETALQQCNHRCEVRGRTVAPARKAAVQKCMAACQTQSAACMKGKCR